MRRLHLVVPAVFLSIAGVVAGASPEIAREKVTLRFDAGQGKPRHEPSAGDQEGTVDAVVATPGDVLFSLAPGDLVTVTLENPKNEFKGRTILMRAETDRITVRYETELIFFKKRVETHHRTGMSKPSSNTLRIGREVHLYLKVDGENPIEVPESGTISFRLRKAGCVRILGPACNPSAVAWDDGRPLSSDEKQEYQDWLAELRAQGYDSVTPMGAVVQKGNLDTLTVSVTARR